MQNLDQSGDSLLHLPSPNSPDSSTVVEVRLTLHVKVLSQGQSMLGFATKISYLSLYLDEALFTILAREATVFIKLALKMFVIV